MRRFLFLLVLVMSVLLAAGCGKFGKKYHAPSNAAGVNGKEVRLTSQDFTDDKVRLADGCDKLFTEKSEGRTHTTSLSEVVHYKHNPPLSGNHYQVPADWGLYPTQSLKDVQTTHNLEHGHIVITFTGLSNKERAEVYSDARINPFHLLVMPRKQDPKPGVYYTVWTHMIYCKHPSKAALQYMIDNYRDQGPELFMQDAQKK